MTKMKMDEMEEIRSNESESTEDTTNNVITTKNDVASMERGWIKKLSRPSYRESVSRGSQTTWEDLGCYSDFESTTTTTTATTQKDDNIRPSSADFRGVNFILGDLRALYHLDSHHYSYNNREISIIDPLTSLLVLSESTTPPSNNEWTKYFLQKVLPQLSQICHRRRLLDEKCSSFTQKRIQKHSTELLTTCFSYWRKSILRHLNNDLIQSIETYNTKFHRHRKKNVMKVWSHIAMGVNSRKRILERRRGGLERARENIAERLLVREECSDDGGGGGGGNGESHNDAGSGGGGGGGSKLMITPEMIRVEIRRLVNAQMKAWVHGYYQRTYFKIWRDQHYLNGRITLLRSSNHFRRKMSHSVFDSWRRHCSSSSSTSSSSSSYAHVMNQRVDHQAEQGIFRIDNDYGDGRTTEAAEYFHRKTISKLLFFRQWNHHSKSMTKSKHMRRKHLSKLARLCLLEWRSANMKRKKLRWDAMLQWMEYDETYYRCPFRRWRRVVNEGKNDLVIRNRLVGVYLRSKSRKRLWSLFYKWRHQAKYGKTTALYGRTQLAFGWLEQRHRCEVLMSQMEGMASSKMELLYQTEEKAKDLEKRLTRSEHFRKEAEEEVKHLQSVNESLSRLSPFAENIEVLHPMFLSKNNLI